MLVFFFWLVIWTVYNFVTDSVIILKTTLNTSHGWPDAEKTYQRSTVFFKFRAGISSSSVTKCFCASKTNSRKWEDLVCVPATSNWWSNGYVHWEGQTEPFSLNLCYNLILNLCFSTQSPLNLITPLGLLRLCLW